MNIFLSTPISCYKTLKEFQDYKETVLSFMSELRKKHIIYAEIENINNSYEYDSPEKSIFLDLTSIKKCDLFILHYPKKMPTSSLIELGFAVAFSKKIIIITPSYHELPYLALGIPAHSKDSFIIESDNIDTAVLNEVNRILGSYI